MDEAFNVYLDESRHLEHDQKKAIVLIKKMELFLSKARVS